MNNLLQTGQLLSTLAGFTIGTSVLQGEEVDPLKDLDSPPSRDVWKNYFSTSHEGAEVRELIQRLQRGRHFDHIVVALEEALRAGKSEPWMYEVLALSMEIEGRPDDEVNRVLLSLTDFNATDVPNLLGSAAYLVRLGAEQQALNLYRQVSRLEPTRPEPYLLGMRLAEKLDDVEAGIWATTGILTYYWFDGYQQQHNRAVKLLSNWKLAARQQEKTELAERIDKNLQRAQIRDLELRLTWSGDADLDLIVAEPLGTTCSFANPHTASGGALLHEGAGPNQAECYEHYVCAFGAPGAYVVTAQYNYGRVVGNRAKLEVIRYAGTDHEQRDFVNVVFDQQAKKFRISLHQGRRTEQTPVFEPVRESSEARRKTTAILLHRLRQDLRYQPPAPLNQISPAAAGAVGYSPVIAPVSSGVRLDATAVVSPDRRYVRLGMQPSITSVTDVFTFSFASGQ
ncbi:tetratricopeptide repeat protein [Rubinisphaera margarita]|uniref:tetratricopeptide repeat protein n=1 Tax=Rubinisphaera margarita TaxID=2909586 RepID=UPI001EE97E63|nr:hypothetical protein [Rubinisphaera margarita]MCG6156639.1 hypothetical protein [Rubinisphaera margarita]